MVRAGRALAVIAVAGCGAGVSTTAHVTALRPGCGPDQRWAGAACTPVGDGRTRVTTAEAALVDFKMDTANGALADIDAHGPFDHDTNIRLWESRGIAAAYEEDPARAGAAFDMLLALDPAHRLSYGLSPTATKVFESSRVASLQNGVPRLDISWAHGQEVGAPVPLNVEVIADPAKFLRRATVFVRRRGEATWRAADIDLGGPGTRTPVTLPAFPASAATAIEVYARGYDDRANEVLTWGDPARPREIPLGYDPPLPWYRKWWVWAAVGGVAATTIGIVVYAETREPPLELPPIETGCAR